MGDNEQPAESQAAPAVLLRGARVVLPGGAADGASVLVERGRIARALTDGGAADPPSARAFDLSGLTLYPGFIDLHIHGSVGVDALAASADDLDRVARFLAAQGVTGWLPTLVPAPDEDYARAVSAIDELMSRQRAADSDSETSSDPSSRDDGPAARALGVHYEGPFVNEAQCGALRTRYFRAYAGPESLDSVPTLAAPRAAHMITVAPEVEGGVELVRELASRGWLVSVGHTRADAGTLDAAAEAGARHMTHFFNAMSPLHHRAPGPVGWGLVRDDVSCDVIADGVHCDPLMLRLALRCKRADRLALISDAVSPAGLGDGRYEIWGESITVEGGRTRNGRGGIAGSVITMLDAARLMLSLGAPPHEVGRMASLTPARLIGLGDELGSIEPGKRADLVALDPDGRARLTIIGGRVAFSTL
jgi:N-acetylglucosamine-6-phosphate deacetylase